LLTTVIIPYYNKINTINRAVESVLNQTYTSWELIIVDDCSDYPLEMEESWKAYPVSLIRNEKNQGPGPSRQRGMEMSTGEYLAFLDADDWWDINFLKESLQAHQVHHSIAATWVRSETLFPDGSKVVRKYSEIEFDNIQETILRYPRPWQTGSLVWKKKYAGNWGNLSTNQDYYFELSSSLNSNKVKRIDQILYFVDQTRGNHRIDLVNQSETVQNHFKLFESAFHLIGNQITGYYRIMLFHRLIRCMLKVAENADPHTTILYWAKLETMYPITKIFYRKQVLLKLAHHSLQKTKFKIYF